MPKLDGVSATSLIRQFDHMTPIISMTSNMKPNEVMTYYHSGTFFVVRSGLEDRKADLMNDGRDERYSSEAVHEGGVVGYARGMSFVFQVV